MAQLKNGGAGPKRRIRTRLETIGNLIIVRPNRSIKPRPANWRELYVRMVSNVCLQPPKHFFGRSGLPGPQPILLPYMTIPLNSSPNGIVAFTLSLEPGIARLQRRAIDWALSQSDVHTWPVPVSKAHTGAGSERFVNTGLHLKDALTGYAEHSFNAGRLQGIPDIDWRHIEQYTAHKGKTQYLGVKTTCGTPCPCRRTIEKLWHLGWEMHY